jgi:hypothetical protein
MHSIGSAAPVDLLWGARNRSRYPNAMTAFGRMTSNGSSYPFPLGAVSR